MAVTDLKSKLKLAKFHGATLFATKVTTGGGKALARKKILNSSKQKVEDLGNNDNIYSVAGFISARFVLDNEGEMSENPSYFEMKENLLSAFAMSTPGIFVNPFGPDIPAAICSEWEIEESEQFIGLTPVTFTLEISSIDEIVVKAPASIDEVNALSNSLDEQTNASIAEGFGVENSGNFADAMETVGDAIDAIKKAAEKTNIALDKLDEFNTGIGNLSSDIAGLVATPQRIADGLTNSIQSIGGLYTSVRGTFGTLVNLFGFGEGSVDTSIQTAVSIERAANKEAINNGVNILAISQAYLQASLIEFETVEEIDEINEILEDQFASLSQDASLTDLRFAAQKVFDEARITARRIIEIESTPTSARLLAYQYYGSSELGDSITELNGYQHSDDISGTIKILTA
ncbi:hypothetical protein LCGC14_1165610 [marine sediment metagenome]|uniref:DNA circulation N-terminal domain-containing protein n=1 Tax=marine sediment metagenome TaxID=412755 RepID=A0A0F9LW94_9ZZZZ